MSDRLHNIVTGSDGDLRLIRQVRKLIKAGSDRETVRRMAIFCRELLEHQKGGDVVLCKKGLPDKVVWFV